MNRKLFSVLILTIALLALGSTAIAQTGVGDLRGHVYLKQADGTKVPVEGAVIDIYRTDVGGRTQVKTKKDGSYVHAGLQYVATYLISISAPGANPKTQSDVKAGRGVEYDIILDPGNGRVLTEAEAKASGASAPTGGGGGNESAADKAKREAAEAANAKIAAANAKVTSSNTVVTDSFKAGNELYAAGLGLEREKQAPAAIAKYDQAIAKYDEGIAVDPEHPGAPQLLTNRSIALTRRAIVNYNLAAVTPSEKPTLIPKVKADLALAAESSNKAVALLKSLEAAGDISGPSVAANRMFALSSRTQAYYYLVTIADSTKANEGVAAYGDYLALETDPVKKAQAEMDIAKMLFDGGESEKAIAAYQKILAEHPDNVDAALGIGLALFQTGETSKFQEAANYLQQFVDKAPATHPLLASAKESLDYLKNEAKIKPVKPTPTRRRGN